MSSDIQYKLTNLELAPPKTVWEKIVADLDDSALEFQFPSRLNELSFTPPAAIWNKIETQLDRSVITENISSKLYSAEVIPPAATWNKIEAALFEEEKAIPQRKRIAPWVRYAAAATVIGFLAFGALQIFKPGKENTGTPTAGTATTNGTTASPGTVQQPDKNNITPADLSDNDEDVKNDAALEESKNTYAHVDMTSQKKIAQLSDFDFSSFSDDITEPGNSGYEEGLMLDEEDNGGRYIVLMTPDGHFIRMSKKLSNLVCCVSGEEEDAKCRSQVDKWRKQLACSPTPHPGNFMDIVSLLGSLQDN
ncbi:MAG TPA: hypothetical protein VMZ03_13600 [Chitinophagaceae bacterium]|nr:hypothetical protein [Chitinophagaceae bacterium]